MSGARASGGGDAAGLPGTTLACRCKSVRIVLQGAPVMCAACHCDSCRRAAARFARLPGAPDLTAAHGGIDYVAYRKDRLEWQGDPALVREFRLSPKSPTRRLVAGCCGTPLCVEVEKAHWASFYRVLWPRDHAPPLEMHAMVRDRLPGPPLDDGLPASPGFGWRFLARLVGAWAAMGFRNPRIATGGPIDP